MSPDVHALESVAGASPLATGLNVYLALRGLLGVMWVPSSPYSASWAALRRCLTCSAAATARSAAELAAAILASPAGSSGTSGHALCCQVSSWGRTGCMLAFAKVFL